MMRYLLILLIAVIGLFAGLALARIAQREIRDYKKIFLACRDATALVVHFTIFIISPRVLTFLVSAVLSAASIFLLRMKPALNVYSLTLLSVPLAWTYDTAAFPYAASTIFIHGSLLSTMMWEVKKPVMNLRSTIKAMRPGTGFLAASLLLGVLTIFL